MDVATYCDWRIDLYDVAFFDEELARLVGQFADLRFRDCSTSAQLRNSTIGIQFINDKPAMTKSDITDLNRSSFVPSIGPKKPV